MLTERELAISPIVQESVQHNAQTLTNLRSLTASLFGVASGILGLESYAGFAFYIFGSLFVSFLVAGIRCQGKPGVYFGSVLGDLVAGGDVLGGLSSFVLTWTGVYGLVRM